MSQVERALVQVEKLLEARAEARRLASRRSRLQPELDRARQQVARREQVLAEEHADVERLEGVSLSRILAGLSGSLTDRVTRERAEREEAAYRLRDARTALARVASEADQLEGDRARLGDVETAYQESLSDLLLTVRVSDHDRAAQIEAEVERRLAAIERRRIQ